MPDPALLDARTVSQRGPVRTSVRWWRGHHAGLGLLTRGLQGPETIETATRVVALHRVYVPHDGAGRGD